VQLRLGDFFLLLFLGTTNQRKRSRNALKNSQITDFNVQFRVILKNILLIITYSVYYEK